MVVTHSLFMCPVVNRHLGFSEFVEIINSAAMHNFGHLAWGICAWIFKNGILGSWGRQFSILLENDKLCLVVAIIDITTSTIKSMLFPHSYQQAMLPDFNFHCGYDIISHCNINLHFIISNKVEHLFLCLFPFTIMHQ